MTTIQTLHALYSDAIGRFLELEERIHALPCAERKISNLDGRMHEVYAEAAALSTAITRSQPTDALDCLFLTVHMESVLDEVDNEINLDGSNTTMSRVVCSVEGIIAHQWAALGKPDLGNVFSNSVTKICFDRSQERGPKLGEQS